MVDLLWRESAEMAKNLIPKIGNIEMLYRTKVIVDIWCLGELQNMTQQQITFRDEKLDKVKRSAFQSLETDVESNVCHLFDI